MPDVYSGQDLMPHWVSVPAEELVPRIQNPSFVQYTIPGMVTSSKNGWLWQALVPSALSPCFFRLVLRSVNNRNDTRMQECLNNITVERPQGRVNKRQAEDEKLLHHAWTRTGPAGLRLDRSGGPLLCDYSAYSALETSGITGLWVAQLMGVLGSITFSCSSGSLGGPEIPRSVEMYMFNIYMLLY